MNILITYMTKTNTTKEVGQKIAQVLSAHDMSVDLIPIQDISDMIKYDGIIIGGPINGMKWVPEAVAFINENQALLRQKKTALYFVSYLLHNSRKIWKRSIRTSLNPSKNIINAGEIGMFGGKIEQSFPTPVRWLFGVNKDLPLDTIKWDDVIKWANELVEYFKKD